MLFIAICLGCYIRKADVKSKGHKRVRSVQDLCTNFLKKHDDCEDYSNETVFSHSWSQQSKALPRHIQAWYGLH